MPEIPTDRLLQYFHDYSDLSKPRVLCSRLAKGADPNATDRFGRSLLYLTAIGCQSNNMHPLLDYGADPNFRDPHDEDGETVLMEVLRGLGCNRDIVGWMSMLLFLLAPLVRERTGNHRDIGTLS